MTAQCADNRSGEDNVANQAETNEQDSNDSFRQGSIEASSINITGMSSLIGYTR